MIFEAENKAALAKGIFEDQVKKAAVHRQHMMSILEGQMELLKNFSEDTEKLSEVGSMIIWYAR